MTSKQTQLQNLADTLTEAMQIGDYATEADLIEYAESLHRHGYELSAEWLADFADVARQVWATYAPAADPNFDLTAIVAADEAETVYVREWDMDTPQSNGEAFVLTNRPDGLRWVADRIPDGGIAIGRYNNRGYGPELPAGYDWRPVEVADLRWYAVDDE